MTRRLAAILAADVVGYSRLIGTDELGTIRALRALRGECVDPAVARHRGRVFKATGDGVLVEFASVVDAVACGIEIQRAMPGRNAALPEQRRLVLRIGINVGDIVIDGEDVLGDGVNVAARLESLCEPGGLCISRSANEQIRDKLNLSFADLGEHAVKNIARAVGVFGLRAEDIAGLPEVALEGAVAAGSGAPGPSRPEIRYCRSGDGTELAFAALGQGSPVVKVGNWMTHLEMDFDNPVWGRLYGELARRHRFVRYDTRGNGLSDREVEDISFDRFVDDLAAVIDAAGIERCALVGISQGCAIAVAYAARHPERVSRMVLYGGYVLGANKRSRTAAQIEEFEATLTLMRLGWGQNNPAFRQMFTTQFIPEATRQQADYFNELQRASTSPETAVRIMRAIAETDVGDLLAKLRAPTLVLHAREDARVPFEMGRRMAAGIPGARFQPLQSRNHLILETEPAFAQLLDAVTGFLAE
ncbi:MAG: alpha/beta fold hydrolase [Alphaproteobacteria bacterium]|nr:alpha/beta fold hydrolase [Alphaproteobacteria bacterium]